jgi:hypothetical protein
VKCTDQVPSKEESLRLKVAVIDLLEFIVTVVEGLKPPASPLQSKNVEPILGVAVKVTTVPLA